MPISYTSERSPTPGRTAIAAPRATLPAPRRSSLWSFLDTLAYPAFIDTLWRLPRNPDQAMYNLWQLARLVHDVAAIQEVGIAKLLTGEPGRNGDDLHPGRQRPLHPRRGVFDRQALPRLEVELARRKEVHLGVGLPVLDVVASDDYVELVLQPQDAEHAPGLFAVGLGGEGRRETFSSDAPEQGYVVGVAVLLDQFRVAQHLLVDAEPDLDVGLPRRVHAELRHTRPGRVLELESPHQSDGDLLTRETHQVSKGSDHLSLVQVGTQFGGGASVGERLYFLGFDKCPVQVEDKRADHTGSTLQVAPVLSKTYEYLCTLRLLSQAASPEPIVSKRDHKLKRPPGPHDPLGARRADHVDHSACSHRQR